MKKYFRPEFLNRIDDIVVFSPLTKAQIMQIITLSVKGLESRLREKDISLVLTDSAREFIADEAYDPNYGARPINRYVQKHIETKIAEMIIKGDAVAGNSVIIEADGDLEFRIE